LQAAGTRFLPLSFCWHGVQDHAADRRGHGRSTRNEQPYGGDLKASDPVAFLDWLKIDNVALVGWSDRGIIGISAAMAHPARLTRSRRLHQGRSRFHRRQVVARQDHAQLRRLKV
jgi:pimeloyl-ACP methyl ester carboxylesterase